MRECLVLNQNGTRDLLNAAAGITVGEHGRSFLAAMVEDGNEPLSPGVAILTSLFTPFRQLSTPTCAIHSIINTEIRNHPERLISMYTQMLRDAQFTFPSGYAVQTQRVVDGFITADLKNGGEGRDVIFEDILSINPFKIACQKFEWQREGIKCRIGR
ncbi:MAG: hypothetical protein LBE98_00705 [Puniceicoccales bacterium]|jgi:hypothetical protein|nr:hypothetical protein [Puniceicoccales bacterium]